MEIAIIVSFILIIFILLTSNKEESDSVFRVNYSAKVFDEENCYRIQLGFEDVIANSPENAIRLVEERLRIQQERENIDLGYMNKEYSNFKVMKL